MAVHVTLVEGGFGLTFNVKFVPDGGMHVRTLIPEASDAVEANATV